MRVAISGASGLVGSALSEQLVATGHSVVRLVRSATAKTPATSDDSTGHDVVHWDPPTGLADPARLDGCDALVHLAGRSIGSGRWSDGEKRRIRDSRVLATQRLAQQLAGLSNPPPVVLSASAIGIYGDRGDEQVAEDSAPGSNFLAQVAQDWESACQPLREVGVRVVHPRLGIVLSRRDGALKKMVPLFRWGLGGRLGHGRQIWSWISLTDTVAALLWMLEQPQVCGPVNCVAPNPVSNREFTASLASVLGRPAIFPAPRWALRLALGEMADALLLTSCHATADRLLANGFQFQHPSLQEALDAELGQPA